MLKSEVIQNKILGAEELQRHLALWRFKDKKIVFTNGCFDILHLGHIDYLMKAADAGDILIIGLNTDASVRKLKGEGRPVNSEHARAMMLASLAFVSAVVLFDEETPYELIQNIQPDVLVKGNDYKIEEIVGYDIVLAKGGEVITVDLLAGYSTTGLIEKLKTK
ncbi:MAG: D-glycero-beta-D-manno-heptose 1-phosphate adenylyltransferase [Bacteroidales bacterium]|nr:D-glycero-beta-D-manno-heptose 1-phosphate adenylyltransferase [Bacteroidales bacterium]